jgi:anaerobic dimethyl sulfoxide reductase subunit B
MQYGFYFDEGRCIQCRTCELACKSTHNLEPGIKWRRIIETWNGDYPKITRSFFSLSCMHCENAPCIPACPTGAISKRVEDGIVLVDRAKCNGCKECLPACPYDVPQFGKDGIMQMCDYCTGISSNPVCTSSCPAEALFFGKLDDLFELARSNEKSVKSVDKGMKPSIIVVNGIVRK